MILNRASFAVIATISIAASLLADAGVTVVDRPSPKHGNRHYVGNRPPLAPCPLVKLPAGAIRPEGWVRKMLELQRDGFHGHLPEISRFLKKSNNAWLTQEGRGQNGWEELPYWLKGFANCGYALDDKAMIDEAKIWIDGAMASQKADGWFGPERGRKDLWPNMIMQFCMQSYYEYSGDARVLDLMTRYCRYLYEIPEDKYPTPYWQHMRGGDQLFSVYWLYNRTGETWLLELAHKVHRKTARWDEDVINWHNVNIAQGFREPAVYSMQTRDSKHLAATERVWSKVRELYGQVPGGLFGGDENCREGYSGPRQAIETCGIAEEMLSDEILLAVTGDPKWADRCEDVAFNSLPASMTADMRALRYLTAPNMPQSDFISKAPGFQNQGSMLLMTPHGHRCCQHNAGHAWPYYAQHLWYAAPSNGLAATLYAPCSVTAKVGKGRLVTITEDTKYPFDESVTLRISCPRAVRFPLYLRIPGWCQRATLTVNDKPAQVEPRPQSFVVLDREWNDGDTVTLQLPMDIALRTWTKNKNSVSVDRGPITYSLKIGERRERHGGTDDWPSWNIYPTTPWNYGLVLPAGQPTDSFKVVRKKWPADDQPFAANATPIQIAAQAKRIPNLELTGRGLIQPMQDSPIKSDQPVETVTLIPMGAARLRLSAFPVIGERPNAREWKPLDIKVSWSYVCGNPANLFDGVIPNNSQHKVPRIHWWPHNGTREWLEIRYLKQRTVSAVSIYWFEEPGNMACKLPESWTVLYKDGAEWKPVRAKGKYGVARNRFNRVDIEPVQTRELKIEVQLMRKPRKKSAGILEMKIE